MIFCPPLCLSASLSDCACACQHPSFLAAKRMARSSSCESVSVSVGLGFPSNTLTDRRSHQQRLELFQVNDCLPSFFLPFCLMMPVACLTLSSITETAIQHWQSRGKFIPFGCRTSEVTNCTAELALSTVSLSPI